MTSPSPTPLERLYAGICEEEARHKKTLRRIDLQYRIGTFIIIAVTVFFIFGPEIIASLHAHTTEHP